MRRSAISVSLTCRIILLPGTSNSISSPSLTNAKGPPMALSGATCKTIVPKAVPLIRASEILTMSRTPRVSNLPGTGKLPTSGMPGAPMGPTFCKTRISFSSTSRSGSLIRTARSAIFLKTTARPVWHNNLGDAAACLITAPSGARLPHNTARPPSGDIGSAREWMILSS